MKFYDPNGNQLNIEEFKNTYNQQYKFDDRYIESILQNGIQSRDDIIKILCWKIGGRQLDDYSVKNRNYTITINDQFVEFVINSSVATDDDAVEALKTIMEVPNIGFTYAVTLLYFMSKGQYPIYDKFAHIALLVIDGGSSFDCIIKDSELQGKGRGKNRKVEIPSNIDKTADDKNEKIKFAFDKYKENYIGRINRIFNMNYGEEMISDRTVDRALWVYGHLFNDKQTNRDRIARIRAK